ncbi:hypothetical protein CPB86DRAFT_212248 [Serendipita vermifera]|nr:hypothetical protein CPB86DRAFT_212248 [Serendipita vermifera]
MPSLRQIAEERDRNNTSSSSTSGSMVDTPDRTSTTPSGLTPLPMVGSYSGSAPRLTTSPVTSTTTGGASVGNNIVHSYPRILHPSHHHGVGTGGGTTIASGRGAGGVASANAMERHHLFGVESTSMSNDPFYGSSSSTPPLSTSNANLQSGMAAQSTRSDLSSDSSPHNIQRSSTSTRLPPLSSPQSADPNSRYGRGRSTSGVSLLLAAASSSATPPLGSSTSSTFERATSMPKELPSPAAVSAVTNTNPTPSSATNAGISTNSTAPRLNRATIGRESSRPSEAHLPRTSSITNDSDRDHPHPPPSHHHHHHHHLYRHAAGHPHPRHELERQYPAPHVNLSSTSTSSERQSYTSNTPPTQQRQHPSPPLFNSMPSASAVSSTSSNRNTTAERDRAGGDMEGLRNIPGPSLSSSSSSSQQLHHVAEGGGSGSFAESPTPAAVVSGSASGHYVTSSSERVLPRRGMSGYGSDSTTTAREEHGARRGSGSGQWDQHSRQESGSYEPPTPTSPSTWTSRQSQEMRAPSLDHVRGPYRRHHQDRSDDGEDEMYPPSSEPATQESYSSRRESYPSTQSSSYSSRRDSYPTNQESYSREPPYDPIAQSNAPSSSSSFRSRNPSQSIILPPPRLRPHDEDYPARSPAAYPPPFPKGYESREGTHRLGSRERSREGEHYYEETPYSSSHPERHSSHPSSSERDPYPSYSHQPARWNANDGERRPYDPRYDPEQEFRMEDELRVRSRGYSWRGEEPPFNRQESRVQPTPHHRDARGAPSLMVRVRNQTSRPDIRNSATQEYNSGDPGPSSYHSYFPGPRSSRTPDPVPGGPTSTVSRGSNLLPQPSIITTMTSSPHGHSQFTSTSSPGSGLLLFSPPSSSTPPRYPSRSKEEQARLLADLTKEAQKASMEGRAKTMKKIREFSLIIARFAEGQASRSRAQQSGQTNQPMTLPRPATKDDVEEMTHRAALIFRMAKDLKTRLEAKRKASNLPPPEPTPIPSAGPSSEPSSATPQKKKGMTKEEKRIHEDMEKIRQKRTSAQQGIKSKYMKRSKKTQPPKKCSSCGIKETPEWRKGPDGPRSLCNACGLHYAKLMRNRANNEGRWIGEGIPPPIDIVTLRQVTGVGTQPRVNERGEVEIPGVFTNIPPSKLINAEMLHGPRTLGLPPLASMFGSGEASTSSTATNTTTTEAESQATTAAPPQSDGTSTPSPRLTEQRIEAPSKKRKEMSEDEHEDEPAAKRPRLSSPMPIDGQASTSRPVEGAQSPMDEDP